MKHYDDSEAARMNGEDSCMDCHAAPADIGDQCEACFFEARVERCESCGIEIPHDEMLCDGCNPTESQQGDRRTAPKETTMSDETSDHVPMFPDVDPRFAVKRRPLSPTGEDLRRVHAEFAEARAEMERLKATLAEVDELVVRAVDELAMEDDEELPTPDYYRLRDVARAAIARHRARTEGEG